MPTVPHVTTPTDIRQAATARRAHEPERRPIASSAAGVDIS